MLIMHALKLSMESTRVRRQNSHGAARAPCVDIRFLFRTAQEQPMSNPYGVQKYDVTLCYVALFSGVIAYRQKYGIYGKHNGKTRI